MTHLFYYLSFTPPTDVSGTALLNGFPLFDRTLPARMTSMPMINAWLAGSRNQLLLDLRSVDGSAFAIKLELKSHPMGSIVTPDSGEPIAISGRSQPEGGIPLQSDPHGHLTFQGGFVSPGLDFSDIFYRAPAPDPIAATAFAHQILEAFQGHAIGELMAWQAHRVGDLATAYGVSREEALKIMTSQFEQAMGYGLPPGWAKAQISVRPWCDGRLLEAVVSSSRPLLHTEKMDLPVFIGQIDGRLQIVR